ncbi:UpxY family transcription antiterminator [Bacteroides fragilis]|nr:UpxY family transcription antiterminator [Bacteroides fragilis]
MKSWLAAYVRLYHEKKTRDRLTAMGIESFLPVQEEIHQWSDRRKKIERVVIPMMIFVHVDPAERAEVLTLSSVSRYMVLRGQSTPRRHPRRADGALPLHARLLRRSHRSVLLPLAPGEQVRVIKGPLAGLEGELVTIDGKSKVAVRLDMLGCAHVDMPVGFVERVGKMEAVR